MSNRVAVFYLLIGPWEYALEALDQHGQYGHDTIRVCVLHSRRGCSCRHAWMDGSTYGHLTRNVVRGLRWCQH
jgi:hypothetical protein